MGPYHFVQFAVLYIVPKHKYQTIFKALQGKGHPMAFIPYGVVGNFLGLLPKV